MTQTTNQVESHNSQIGDYLKFYIEMNGAPGYAVFLDGEWGSGKTWFINKFRDAHKDKKFLYVSLYGVTSISEIDDQFFQQLHPVLASKPFTIGAKLLKGALKGAIKVDLDDSDTGELNLEIPSLDIQKFLNDSEGRILIFDDLERCEILEKAMGYINHFVERQGQKVILVGHEGEIQKLDQFRKKNEKLIGRRFSIFPEIVDALNVFISSTQDDATQRALRKNTDLILKIFKRSRHNNLRTLKYSIMEFERFLGLLPKEAKQNDDFLSACIDTFFSICIELRSGVIAPDTIKHLTESYRSHVVNRAVNKDKKDSKTEPDDLAKMYEKHFGSSLQELIPTEESLYYFFESGFVPKHVAENAIYNNRFFIRDTTPSWIKLWRIYDLTDKEFENFTADVIERFKKYEYKKQGELRHVAGILLRLSKDRVIFESHANMKKMVTNVVKEMISKKIVEQISEEEDSFARFDDVYAGLQFQSYNDEIFKKLSSDLKNYQKFLRTEKLRASSTEILTIMQTDAQRLFRVLTVSNANEQKLYGVPALQYVNPKDFVSTLIAMKPSGRLNVAHIFKERYTMLNAYPELAEEESWLKQVDSELTDKLPKLKQPTRYTLTLLRTSYLAPARKAIKDWKKRKQEEKKNQLNQAKGKS